MAHIFDTRHPGEVATYSRLQHGRVSDARPAQINHNYLVHCPITNPRGPAIHFARQLPNEHSFVKQLLEGREPDRDEILNEVLFRAGPTLMF